MKTKSACTKNLCLMTGLLLLAGGLNAQANIFKADTTTMSASTDWAATDGGVPGVAPSSSVVGEFGLTPSSASLSAMTLGGSVSLLGLQFDNTTTGPLTVASTGGYTLTLAGSGINMSSANNNVTLNCAVALGATQSWAINTNLTLTVGGAISDGGSGYGITASGSGTLILSGNESFQGQLLVGAGNTVILSGNNSARPANANNLTTLMGTLQLQANPANTVSGTSYALSSEETANGPLNPDNGSTIQLRSDSDVTFAGANNLGGFGGEAITIDVNRLTSAGTNNTLTFSPGGFNVYNATLNVTGGSGDTLAIGPVLEAYGSSMIFNVNSANLTVNGINDAAITFNGGFNSTVTGVISSASLSKNGTGTLTLSAANTYTGPTTISAGTLLLSVSGALAGASTISIGAGGTFDVSALGGTYTLGSGGLNASGTGTTVGTTAATIVPASGGVFDLSSQPVSLTWNGASSGTDSTHPALNVSQGTLNFSGNTITVIVPGTALGAGTYTLVRAAAITGSPNSTPSYIGGNGLQLGASGLLSVVGGNTLVLTVQNIGIIGTWNDGNHATDDNWSDPGNWSGGVPHLAGDTAVFGSVVSPVVLNTAESVGTLLFTNSSSYTISGGNTLTLDNNASGAAVNVTAGAANAINTSVALNDNATITVSSGQSLSISGSITNGSGAKTLTLSGAGTNILSGANSYGPSAGSVGTILSGGTLQVGNNTALGSGDVSITSSNTLQSGAAGLSVSNNITVASSQTATVDNNGNNLTLAGVISGSGNVSGIGSGTLTLSGNESFQGQLIVGVSNTVVLSGNNSARPVGTTQRTVVNGILQLQANAGNTSGGTSTALSTEATADPLNVNGGGTVQLRSDSNVTFAGANNLGGVGFATITFDVNRLTSAGTNNTITFAPGGFNTYATIINVTGGSGDTLALGPINTGYGGPLSFNANSANLTINGIANVSPLTFDGGFNSTVTGAISGDTLNKNGTGTLTLSGANSYTGNTTINAGTLQADGFIPGAVVVNGGTLNGIGSIAGTVTVAPSGNLGAGDPGTNIGTLTTYNDLTLQGNATLRINKTGGTTKQDNVTVSGNVTYGGVLTVTNITSDSTVITTNDTFQIFNVSGSSSGNFTNIVGSPGAGLGYSFNPTNGVLSVVAAPLSGLKFTASPVISGTSLKISATYSGAGTVYLLTSTNLAASLNTWTPVWTNVLSGGGSFTTNLPNAVNPASKQQFYILSNTNN